MTHIELPEPVWRAPQEVLRAAHEASQLAPTPARITLALDSRGLDGPEVDIACRAREPEVDLWETGLAIPTWDQLTALAELTGYPVGFFYRPEPTPIGPIFLCSREDIDPPLDRLIQAPASSFPVRRPTRPRPNSAAAEAAAKHVLAAREQRRRAREAGDLIPAPPGWRTRR